MNSNAFANITSTTSVLTNRCLRNTYMLLAISMLPTILGAMVGVKLNLSGFFSGIFGFLIAFAIAGGFIYAIEKNKTKGVGVALLLGFTFYMGVLLSGLLQNVLSFSNGPSLIALAFGGTAAVFASMSAIAATSKRDFSGIYKWAFIGVIVLIVASIANIFLQLPVLQLGLSVMAIIIFSAFLLADVQRVINGGETNYISATLSIYLNLYNIFSNLLSLLGVFGGERE